MIHYQFQHSWWVHKAILQLCVKAGVHLVHKKDLLFPKSTRFYGKSKKDKWAAALSKRTPLNATRCSCCAIKFRTFLCLSHWIVDWKYQRAPNKKKKELSFYLYANLRSLDTIVFSFPPSPFCLPIYRFSLLLFLFFCCCCWCRLFVSICRIDAHTRASFTSSSFFLCENWATQLSTYICERELSQSFFFCVCTCWLCFIWVL